MALSCGPVQRVSPGTLTAVHAPDSQPGPSAVTARRTCSSLSERPAPPVRGGCVGLCREVLDGARARRSAARGHRRARSRIRSARARRRRPPESQSPPSPSSPEATGWSLVVRRRSGSRCCWASASVIDSDFRPPPGLPAGRAAGGGRRGSSGPARVHPPASGADDVGVNPVTHAGAPPEPVRHQPVQKTRVLTITSDRSRENSRSRGRARAPSGDQRARLTRRRARAGKRSVSNPGAPTGLWRSGVCSGPPRRLGHSRLTRSAILATSVAASLRWTPGPRGCVFSRVALLASGQSDCRRVAVT